MHVDTARKLGNSPLGGHYAKLITKRAFENFGGHPHFMYVNDSRVNFGLQMTLFCVELFTPCTLVK